MDRKSIKEELVDVHEIIVYNSILNNENSKAMNIFVFYLIYLCCFGFLSIINIQRNSIIIVKPQSLQN